jgi:ATP/maltotriose-dependent transcriptional regulator MalT
MNPSLYARIRAFFTTVDQVRLWLARGELEVLHLLARGDSNQKIADELMVSKNTVKRHMRNIFEKLGVENRVQVVVEARSLGLLSDEPTGAGISCPNGAVWTEAEQECTFQEMIKRF